MTTTKEEIPNPLVFENTRLNLLEIKEKKARLNSKPLYFNIDLTGRCNINPPCVFCTQKSDGYHYQPINISYLQEYLQFINRCEKINDCSFGEPLTHPGFLDLIQQTAGRGQRFGFSTNGLLLTMDRADLLVQNGKHIEIIVSVNAATSETYYKLTGQHFDRLLKNLEYFIRKYKERFPQDIPPVYLSFICMRLNRAEINDFMKLAGSLGVMGVNLRPLFRIGQSGKVREEFGYNFVYEQEMFSPEEYKEIGDDARQIANKLGVNLTINWDNSKSEINNLAEPNVDIPCLFPWKFLFVQQHSKNVYICCYTNSAIDSLDRRQLDQIWNGQDIRKIRHDLSLGRIPQFCLKYGNNCPLVAEFQRSKRIKGILKVGMIHRWFRRAITN